MQKERESKTFGILPQKLSVNSRVQMRSGNSIPVIGYGTYQLKGQDCLSGLYEALQMGYRHIDTASIYKNQTQICEVLKKFPNIKREDLYITSKISPSEQGYENAKQACDQILKRLDCGYLDLILIHWPGVTKLQVDDPKNAEIRLATWKALLEMKKQGKVKDIGVSNFLSKHLEHLVKHYPNPSELPAVNQIQLHPLLIQQKAIQFCFEHGIVVESYSPLARGAEELFQNKVMLKLSEKYNKTIAQISLRYLLQRNFVILPKSKTQKRIKENLQVFDFQISNQDMKLIVELKEQRVRTCWNPNNIKY